MQKAEVFFLHVAKPNKMKYRTGRVRATRYEEVLGSNAIRDPPFSFLFRSLFLTSLEMRVLKDITLASMTNSSSVPGREDEVTRNFFT